MIELAHPNTVTSPFLQAIAFVINTAHRILICTTCKEAAVQQQQKLQDHHRIVDSDRLYVAPPRAQIEAGPSRNSWHVDVAGDESDMILG